MMKAVCSNLPYSSCTCLRLCLGRVRVWMDCEVKKVAEIGSGTDLMLAVLSETNQ